MSRVTCDMTISVDGYVAGPDQSLEHPIGQGGDRLHRWIFEPQGEDERVIERWHAAVGVRDGAQHVRARGDEWDLGWKGW